MSKASQNRYVTVTELCELIGLSKNSFYALQKNGIFAAVLRSSLNNRPVFDTALVEQYLGIVRTRVGANGTPYVPNRKKATPSRETQKKSTGCHRGLIEALASLGLTATPAQVAEAIGKLPKGGAGMDEPELIRQGFLELRKKGWKFFGGLSFRHYSTGVRDGKVRLALVFKSDDSSRRFPAAMRRCH